MSLREKKTAKMKKEILRSAVSIIAERGYHATTMEDIASKLLMTKGAVYYYFKDKQDLLFQSQKMLLSQSIHNVQSIQKMNLPILDRLEKAMVTHIEYLITERSGFNIGAKPEQFFSGEQLAVIMELRNNYSNAIDQLIIEGIEEGVFESVDVKVVRNIILGAMNWVIEWYSPEGKSDKETLAKSISNYLLKILIKI